MTPRRDDAFPASPDRPNACAEPRLLVLLLAVALDLLLGEPPARLHPVSWIGAGIDALERAAPSTYRRGMLVFGLISTCTLTALATFTAFGAACTLRRLPLPVRVLGLALLLKPAFALRMLLSAGTGVQQALQSGDLPGARLALRSLVGRETAELSDPECAAAAVESLAENTTDSIVGPWLAYAAFGLPGAWAFRTINTLDSRWGYHGSYEWLGSVPAVLDDVAAYLPARLSAILLIAGAPTAGGSPSGALHALLRDRALTLSPNAGWTMSAMAGGLGRRLEKRGHYLLNPAGPPCSSNDIRRAQRVVGSAAVLGLLALGAALRLCCSRVFRQTCRVRDPVE